MRTLKSVAAALFLTLAIRLVSGAEAPARLDLQDGDRVVLLGDTFIEREPTYGYIEARIVAHIGLLPPIAVLVPTATLKRASLRISRTRILSSGISVGVLTRSLESPALALMRPKKDLIVSKNPSHRLNRTS